ncbi:MAG: phospholipase [Betaproteobacteria bacterium]
MKPVRVLLATCLVLFALPGWTWSNHSLVTYRAFDTMPELAQAPPVTAEPLETFLKAEETSIAELLVSQEQWARANMPQYAPRASALEFKPVPGRSDAERRHAFLTALRVSPLSRFALYLQPDPRDVPDPARLLPHDAVNFLPEQPHDTHRFIAIAPQQKVTPLAVLSSASDEPDYGLDINLWQDSPSEWGKAYGFGTLAFGNPALYYATQAPFHMGFYHQNWLIYKAAPFIQRTYPLMRIQQFSSLATLAFRTGHDYWGWRFAGLALHYIQDLTQPFHADLAPGDSTLRLISANVLAMAGFPGRRDDLIVLLSNRHLALEKFQNESMVASARAGKDTPLELALRRRDLDAAYPVWSPLYARDTVSLEAHAISGRTVQTILATMPPALVSDPKFDFGVKEADIDLLAEIDRFGPGKRAELETWVAELLGHLGAHSRNAVRGVLKAAGR